MVLKLGTSNLVLPGTKKDFHAEFQSRSRLFYYATLFNSIQLNSTSYKVPEHSTFRKWRDDVTGEFKFSIKLSRAITHAKKLKYFTTDVSSFMEASRDLVFAKEVC